MRLFWEIALRSFRKHLTYRAATIAGLLTNFFFGWLKVSVLLALYNGRSVVEGISQNDLYAFVASPRRRSPTWPCSAGTS